MQVGGNDRLKSLLDRYDYDDYPLTIAPMQNRYRMQICKWYRANVSQNLPLMSKSLRMMSTRDISQEVLISRSPLHLMLPSAMVVI